MEKAIKASDIAQDDDELSMFNADADNVEFAIRTWCEANDNRSMITVLCEPGTEPDKDGNPSVLCNSVVHGDCIRLAKALIAIMADLRDSNVPGMVLRAAAKFYVNELSSAEADDTPTEADTAETTTDNEQADNNNQA
jgi:hypothetical protein